MERVLITGGTVIPMTGAGHVFDHGVVLAEAGRIVYAGPAEGAPPVTGPSRFINAAGKIVLPGLVNAHCHAAMTLLRGYADEQPLGRWLRERIWPAEGCIRPDDVYWGTALGAYEMLSGGITTFMDMYFHVRQAARAVRDTGIRAVLAPGVRTVGKAVSIELQLNELRRLHGEWHGWGEGQIRILVGPHAPYSCDSAGLIACAELADELRTGLHIHLSETEAEVAEALAAWGCTPIEHVHRLGLLRGRHVAAAHCVHPTEADLAILADTGTSVCHCPVSNLKLASGVTPVAAMRRSGINVGIGTDGAASDNVLHLLGSELRVAALIAKNREGDPSVFSAYDMLEMATLGGAKAVGLGAEVGSLEPGKWADIALIDATRPHMVPCHDPVGLIVYSAQPADVAMTIVGGRVVYEGGRLTQADGAEICREAASAAGRIAAEACPTV